MKTFKQGKERENNMNEGRKGGVVMAILNRMMGEGLSADVAFEHRPDFRGARRRIDGGISFQAEVTANRKTLRQE